MIALKRVCGATLVQPLVLLPPAPSGAWGSCSRSPRTGGPGLSIDPTPALSPYTTCPIPKGDGAGAGDGADHARHRDAW